MSHPPSLTIGSRFNGPARSANGGYTAGMLAGFLPAGAVRVTLRTPPPLETRLDVSVEDGHARLVDGETLVADAETAELAAKPVPPVSVDVALEAMQRYEGHVNHPFPTCFTCGPDRAPYDGLRIFPGHVERGLSASTWTPHSSLEIDGKIPMAVTWAALDCVGGWSVPDLPGRPSVLGRMTGRVDAAPRTGRALVVVGRHLGTEGRKSFTESALYDDDDGLVAQAQHVWIAVDPAGFNG